MYTVQRKSDLRHKDIVHLWEFLFELLADERCGSIITWIAEQNGEFKLENPEQVAKLWGAYKGVKAMNYEKLSRALRTYYSKGIIEKVSKIGNVSLLRQLSVHVIIKILCLFSYQDDSSVPCFLNSNISFVLIKSSFSGTSYLFMYTL